jgi:cell division protein FtsI/penicillin-binding protein 2
VILEWTLGGTLGGTQWINGRIRWEPSVSRRSPFVRQLAGAAGFGASVELEGGRNIPLSLDETLTDDLQQELDEFSSSGTHGAANGKASHVQAGDLAFATIVLASVKTGEILGVAEYGPSAAGGGSWLLKPVNVGSAIKPLLAAATLMQRPDLGSLEVKNDGPTMYDVWGFPLGKGFESGSACPSGWIGLRQFLTCSSNRFSAALVAAALNSPSAKDPPGIEAAPGVTFRLDGQTHSGQRLHIALDRNHQVRADTLNASVLAAGLFALDSLNTSLELAAQLGREGRDSSVWLNLRDDRLNPVRVPLGLWPEQSRLAMMRGNRPATVRQLAMFSVGAAENRVTTLDLTEAFARIVTDRRVGLTFVPSSSKPSFPSMALSNHAWYPVFVSGLHDVGTVGTAKGTQSAVTQQLSADLLFYGKSGTLNAPPHVRTLRRTDTSVVNGAPVVRTLTFADTVVPPVVAKTLLFAVGARAPKKPAGPGAKHQQEDASGGAIDCGVVGTIYFRLRRNPPHVESLATDFANERLWRVLRKNWQRLKVC